MMAHATETGYGTDSDPDLGVLVPPCLLNMQSGFVWTEDDEGEPLDSPIEQDARAVSVDRPDLFPTGPAWKRLDLGGVIVFLRRPQV